MGVKPLATGEVRRADGRSLRRLLQTSGYGSIVKLAFRKADGEGNVGYCLWRFEWVKKALDWLDGGERIQLAPYHLHWIQGLLYGYAEEAIESFLATPSERVSIPGAQMTNGNAEILSAISMLAERIEKVESKIDRLASKGDRVELILSEVAKKLLAPAECRALGISDLVAVLDLRERRGAGGSRTPGLRV